MTQPVKAKRKLKDLDFSGEGAHLALVHKDQGGPCNGADYALVLKAKDYSTEFVQKMQQIQVTLELPEFLRKFFSMYYEDAEVLAKMLGYVEPETDVPDDYQDYWEQCIQDRIDSYVILKSLHDAEDAKAILADLDESQYLSLMQDQQVLEKAFSSLPVKNSPKPKAKVNKAAQAAKASEGTVNVSKARPLDKTKEKEMEELVALQKSLDEQKVELQKALGVIAAMETEKKEAVIKARLDKLEAVVKDEAKALVLFKAVGLLQDEAEFTEVLKALGDMQVAVEKSALFQEQGVQVEESVPAKQESAVAKVLKARLAAGANK